MSGGGREEPSPLIDPTLGTQSRPSTLFDLTLRRWSKRGSLDRHPSPDSPTDRRTTYGSRPLGFRSYRDLSGKDTCRWR